MLIDSALLKEALYKIKDEAINLLDRAKHNKVRSAIEARISVVEAIFVWLNTSEKQGAINMIDLKLGELTQWQPTPRKGALQIDQKIIDDAKNLKKNFDAIKVTVKEIKWNTFAGRTYVLREEGKIPKNVVPRKDEKGVPYLVYLDEPNPKRGKKG